MFAALVRVFNLHFVTIDHIFILARHHRLLIIDTIICILFFTVFIDVDPLHHWLYLLQSVLPELILRAQQHLIFLITSTFNGSSRTVILRVNV